MNFFVDTNLLLHAANRDVEEHATARGALQGWLGGSIPWCVGWNVIYEFLRVSTHPRVFPRPLTSAQAMQFIQVILDCEVATVLVPTNRHFELLDLTIRELGRAAGNIFHDVHTAVLMREHGVQEIMSLDTDFEKFSFLRRRDPTRISSSPR